jgi:hypothetical protein
VVANGPCWNGTVDIVAVRMVSKASDPFVKESLWGQSSSARHGER